MLTCPVCSKLHPEDELQAITILKCAEQLTKKARSARSFTIAFEAFISFLDTSGIEGIEARAYLVEMLHALDLKNSNIQRSYFGSEKILAEATRMKERIIAKRVRAMEMKRPKQMCPVCLKFHFYSAEIPDKCWQRALKGDYTLSYEFNKFLKENSFGELTL